MTRVFHPGCLTALSLLLAATSAPEIDMTGRWRVVLDDQNFDADAVLDIHFTQTGSTLATDQGWAGTIDSATGAFHLEAVFGCGGIIGPPDPRTSSIDGTVDPGGDSFAGTFIAWISPTRSCLQLAGPATGTRVLFTGCGNQVLDPGEQCDDGPGGGPCCAADCALRPAGTICGIDPTTCFDAKCTAGGQCFVDPTSQPNGDGDRYADRCDPCTGGPPIVPSRLQVAIPPASGKMKARGRIPLPGVAGIDPVADGLRVRITDIGEAFVFDATAPGGAYERATKAGWKMRKNGWSFRGPSGGADTLDRAVLKVVKGTPGTLDVRLRGTVGTASPFLPLTLTVVLDPPFATTGLCGETAYPFHTGCETDRSGRKISCRSDGP